ncbi:MAG: 3-hydroxybutyrate dehydrogenase [Rhodoplanes sp.]|uniref:3-hydroxybutyrate dehydrogenase n=1 Tax=Rhodoplanes sp. TaxID=1968906 RepID=UPI001830F33B|nr:3-hydroxybutyrate dehydrogenase [Rhodoplanes sp.]NVO15784.1 3-hydroxybutyrate dehydrogenase [Rhodoplanes sp.]
MLKQRNAIVTGATSGIGLAIAKALADCGCNLMIGGFAPVGVPERLCADIGSQNGVKVFHSGADLSKPEEARRLVADAIAAMGTVDILVNDAGLQFVAPIVEFPEERWDHLRSVMLDAQFHLIKAVLPGMIARSWGRIVNISSVHGLVGSPHKPAYIAAKHGVVGLTKAVALEVAEHGITCNAICPGLVLTDLIRNQLPDQAKVLGCTEDEALKRVFLANTPTQRAIDPAEIGATAAFLCSDGAKSITGTTIVVDGGYTAR